MGQRLNKLIGMKKEEFDELVSNKEIKLRKSMLIPALKVGDEMSLTSILLSSMKLIREFRRTIKSDIKMAKGGTLYTYTEVEFPDSDGQRIDGLMLVVKSGKIKDAAAVELKNGANTIEKKQIESYVDLCKRFNIPKLLTVSNEYVSEPSQFPLDIKTPKNVDLYHLSWSYILTVGHLLLFDNDQNIEDEDQVHIMNEVISHFEHDRSGVCGFTQMKPGWTETVNNINNGSYIKAEDKCVNEAVLSWQQEERDIALKLSQDLGVLVKSGESKYKNDYLKRIEDDTRELVANKHLHSIFSIDGAVSDMRVTALLEKRAIDISVNLQVPKNKTVKGQVGWVKRQLDKCKSKEPHQFSDVENNLYVEFHVKNSSKKYRKHFDQVDDLVDELKDREIKLVKVIMLKDFGKKFAARNKFIDLIESMIFSFYSTTVQHLKNWEPSAPKIKPKRKSHLTEEKGKNEGDVPVIDRSLPLVIDHDDKNHDQFSIRVKNAS